MNKFVLLSLSAFIFLTSCNKPPVVINKYTIKFINDDGSILQTSEVEEGKYPVYEGDTPSKTAPNHYEYVYIGWDKPIVKATEDTTYKASYDYVFLFGTYPQTLVTDIELINELKKGTKGDYDYITYNGKEYYEYLSEQNYIADDGTRVKKGNEIYKYYEVKPIQWKILDEDTEKFYTTYKLLDTCNFNEEFEPEANDTIYPNNYYESKIRKYLDSKDSEGNPIESGFKWRAFRGGDTEQISMPLIRNDENSTCDEVEDHPYVCANIPSGTDYVFALSREELWNPDYGFVHKDNIDSGRVAKSTDYARGRNSTLFVNNASTYWTRSPSASDFTMPKYNVYNVLCDGAITFNATDFEGRCIRPAIKLKLS